MFDCQRRRPVSWTAIVALAGLLVASVAAPASAHVTVQPTSAPKGGFAVVSFSVPNERPSTNTVALQVLLPPDHPIPSVSIRPLPGWTHAVDSTKLAKPLQTDDGVVDQAVSTITWNATGPGIAPGEFELFTVSIGPLPKAKQLIFKALQTYSNGEIVRWIETTPRSGPEPENPAPTLKLTRAKNA
jgi:uncharacterized protein YcnI